MKKLGLTILGVFLLLGIATPMISADAVNSGPGTTSQTSSWHTASWGWHSGEAFTQSSFRHSGAFAEVSEVATGGGQTQVVLRQGQTARAVWSMGANAARSHSWGEW